MNLGRLEKITDLRDVWKTEAQDFTPWLANDENLALLGDTIGLDLECEAVEKDVGPFRADILCKDTANDSWVLIENQVERTDHTHLGQLLTYAAGLKTVTIVWIAQRFTDEHRAALDWLNEVTGDEINFFGLEVELWRIGESAIAPKFNIVSKANEWTKGKAATAHVSGDKDLSDTKKLQLEYWQQFRDYVTENSSVMKPQKPAPCHWMNFSIGTSRAYPHVLLNTRDKMISIRLQINKSSERMAIFNLLLQDKEEIEAAIGSSLDWEELPEKQTSYISLRKPDSDPSNKSNWPEQQAWMLEKLELFRATFGLRIKDMDVDEWHPEEDTTDA